MVILCYFNRGGSDMDLKSLNPEEIIWLDGPVPPMCSNFEEMTELTVVAALIRACKRAGKWGRVTKDELEEGLEFTGLGGGVYPYLIALQGMIDRGLIIQDYEGTVRDENTVYWKVTPRLLELLITSEYSGRYRYENVAEMLVRLKLTEELYS
jgi:hypothetical protein